MRHSPGSHRQPIFDARMTTRVGRPAKLRIDDPQPGGSTMAHKLLKLTGSDRPEDAQDAVWAIHHCLKYISQDALELGMSQTANLLEMIAHLAVDEAKALRIRH